VLKEACLYFPGKRYEDWELIDPAGQPLEAVRATRDELKVVSLPWSTTC
jgi:arsenate reductase (thioredoxin)